MKKTILNSRPALAAAAAAILVLAAGTVLATPAAPKAPAAAATVLEYKMPAGRALTYQSKSEESQVMEVMGQSMDTSTSSASTFTFKAKGPKEKNLLMGVTIDEMSASVTGPQGDMSPDMSSLKAKSFDMVLSPLGAEVDVTGAEALSYAIGGESRTLVSGFKTFFPDMPGKPVKIGDTWPSSDSVEEKTSSMTIKIDLQNVNTLEGFETIDGMECARINAQTTGTVTGSGNQGGMDLTFAGTVKGKNIWYFAVKEGFFVKQTSESTTEMSIDVASAGMTIPVNQTSKGEVKLTGKQ
jgi:hypothetical protein